MSRDNFNSAKSIKTFAAGIAITFVAFIFQGLSFMVLANAVGSDVGLFDSLMATSASTVLATLPITIGGSGLAELGLWAYVHNLNSIPDLDDILKDSQLSVVIVWRIASYHVPLIIMWIALMKTIGRGPLRDTKTSPYLISEKKDNDISSASPHDQNKKVDRSDNSE
jgi:uncharacterized protein (TIRG00374 family)